MRTPPKKQHGLTLIELLVVLSLVAVISTVALRSVVGTLDQNRYDANIRQLEEIEKAVLGVDGRGGFLRDIGRLPVAKGNDPRTQLQELWIQGDLPDYTAGDPNFPFGSGWDGPYLNLGINRRELTDGFGNTFEFFQANGDLVEEEGDTIAIIRSLGADRELGGEGYDEDLTLVFEANADAVDVGIVDESMEADRWRRVLTVIDDKKYAANIQQVEEIEKAVLGDGAMAGFVSDIGRLPVARGVIDAKLLVELWDRSVAVDAGIELYAINQAPGDSEVRLGTGWRGPYLNLGFNRSELTDGFGNPFWLWKADGDPALVGDEIAIVQSLGLSGTLGGTGYEADLEIVFQVDEDVLSPPNDKAVNNWQRNVLVSVQRQMQSDDIAVADGEHVIVRVYGADGSGGLHTVQEKKITLTGNVPSLLFTFENLPHGPKVFRAYQDTTDPADKEDPIVTDPPPVPPVTSPHERKSPAKHVIIDRFTGTLHLTLN